MSYAIVATYRARDGAAEDVKGHLEQMISPTRDEPGCRAYDVYRSHEDSSVFVLVEVYDDEAAFERHREADYFATHILDGAIPLLAQRDVIRCGPLA